jgi:hypothetical protein
VLIKRSGRRRCQAAVRVGHPAQGDTISRADVVAWLLTALTDTASRRFVATAG